MTVYQPAFAQYFDHYATDWVRDVSPLLVDWFESRLPTGRRAALDLCCGGGITLEEFTSRGWSAVGLDHSPGMLAVAEQRLRDRGLEATLIEESVQRLPEGLGAYAVTCLDGALNHLPGIDALTVVLTRLARTMPPGGHLAFDLYEPHHFLHWNHVGLTDRSGTLMAKRGVWDPSTGHGMLRVSGHHTTPSGEVVLVDQVLESWTFERAEVASALASAGFVPVAMDVPWAAQKCHSGTCSQDERPCRTIHTAMLLGG